MLSELLSVVGEEDHDGLVTNLQSIELVEKSAEALVDIEDLFVVFGAGLIHVVHA